MASSGGWNKRIILVSSTLGLLGLLDLLVLTLFLVPQYLEAKQAARRQPPISSISPEPHAPSPGAPAPSEPKTSPAGASLAPEPKTPPSVPTAPSEPTIPSAVASKTSEPKVPTAPEPKTPEPVAPSEPTTVVSKAPGPEPSPAPEHKTRPTESLTTAPSTRRSGHPIARVFFATNLGFLDGKSRATICRVATEHKGTTDQFLVIGHTDSRGAEEFNDQLARTRAKNVVDQLATCGIPQTRIRPLRSKGSTAPLLGEDTPQAWAKNRRVEIFTISGKGR